MNAGTGTLSRGRSSSAEAVEVCSLRIGEELFGLAIGHIVEIIGSAKLRTVPLAPTFLGGLVHYRGDVLTTVSLRSLLGLLPPEGTQDAVVIETAAGPSGILVDAVGDVLTVSAAEFETLPSTLSDVYRRFFLGTFKLTNDLLIMLDPEKLDPLVLAAGLGI